MTSYSLSQYLPPVEAVAVFRGDTYKTTIALIDENDAPIDLTDVTVLSEIRRTSDSTLVDTFTPTIVAENGLIELTLNATQTAGLPTVEILKADVQVTNGADVTTYLVLRIQVVADVSA